jgi:membrane protein
VFYTLFSLAPLLLIVISVAGLMFGEQAARGEILGQLSAHIGPGAASTVQDMLEALNQHDAGIGGTVLGVLALLVGATTVFAELSDAMNRIWRAPQPVPSGVWQLLRTRLLSLGLVLGIGFLLMVSLVASAALSALARWWGPAFGDFALLAQAVNAVVSLVLVTAVFAMIYKWMPSVRVAWRDVWVGAALTALLFTVGKSLIGLYIGTSGVTSPFGAAGSLVVLLVWVYWSAQIFLLGAEFTWVFAHRYGSLQAAAHPAAPVRPLPQRPVLPAGPASRA